MTSSPPYQFTPGDASPWQPDPVKVQKSSDQFNPPQILTHLYQCSRGFAVGAMRPGTKVEVFDNGQVIAAGEAADGTAHVRVVHQFGLPFPGTVLKLRQRMCPKPPPPGGATESVVVTPSPDRAAPGQEGARRCAARALDTLLLLGKSTGPQFPYTID